MIDRNPYEPPHTKVASAARPGSSWFSRRTVLIVAVFHGVFTPILLRSVLAPLGFIGFFLLVHPFAVYAAISRPFFAVLTGITYASIVTVVLYALDYNDIHLGRPGPWGSPWPVWATIATDCTANAAVAIIVFLVKPDLMLHWKLASEITVAK